MRRRHLPISRCSPRFATCLLAATGLTPQLINPETPSDERGVAPRYTASSSVPPRLRPQLWRPAVVRGRWCARHWGGVLGGGQPRECACPSCRQADAPGLVRDTGDLEPRVADGQRVLHTLGDAVADGCFGASVFAAVNVSLAVATVVLVWAGWTASLASGMRGWRLGGWCSTGVYGGGRDPLGGRERFNGWSPLSILLLAVGFEGCGELLVAVGGCLGPCRRPWGSHRWVNSG